MYGTNLWNSDIFDFLTFPLKVILQNNCKIIETGTCPCPTSWRTPVWQKNVECLNNVYSFKISLYNPIELITENNQFCVTCLINSEANCRLTLNQAIARVAAEYLQNSSPDTVTPQDAKFLNVCLYDQLCRNGCYDELDFVTARLGSGSYRHTFKNFVKVNANNKVIKFGFFPVTQKLPVNRA